MSCIDKTVETMTIRQCERKLGTGPKPNVNLDPRGYSSPYVGDLGALYHSTHDIQHLDVQAFSVI